MKKLILSNIILAAVTLVSYATNTNVETKTLKVIEADYCEELREMVYSMLLLDDDIEEDEACAYATIVQNACDSQRK